MVETLCFGRLRRAQGPGAIGTAADDRGAHLAEGHHAHRPGPGAFRRGAGALVAAPTCCLSSGSLRMAGESLVAEPIPAIDGASAPSCALLAQPDRPGFRRESGADLQTVLGPLKGAEHCARAVHAGK